MASPSADAMTKMEDKASMWITKGGCYNQEDAHDKESDRSLLKQQLLLEQQRTDIRVFYITISIAT